MGDFNYFAPLIRRILPNTAWRDAWCDAGVSACGTRVNVARDTDGEEVTEHNGVSACCKGLLSRSKKHGCTYFDGVTHKNRRIDFVLYNAALRCLPQRAFVHTDATASDHKPLTAHFMVVDDFVLSPTYRLTGAK